MDGGGVLIDNAGQFGNVKVDNLTSQRWDVNLIGEKHRCKRRWHAVEDAELPDLHDNQGQSKQESNIVASW
jgi:hypothetical protein